MNLIEQLGGYENAKRELELKEQDSVLQCCASVTANMIRSAMLEYRRQHNIFEVGDRIVKASRLNDDKVYQVFEVADSLNWVKTSCGAFIDAPMFKHATDAEIQAGERL